MPTADVCAHPDWGVHASSVQASASSHVCPAHTTPDASVVVVVGAGLLVTVVEVLVVELAAVGDVLVEVEESIVVVEVIGG